MIGLIARGRNNNDGGSPVFCTVPWSPRIARHIVPQLPGSALSVVRAILDACERQGVEPCRLGSMSRGEMVDAIGEGYTAFEILAFEGTLRIMADLQLYHWPGASS